MNRKEELEEIIEKAAQELNQINNHARASRELDYHLQWAKADGVTEEEILGVVDLLYHPENYNDEA